MGFSVIDGQSLRHPHDQKTAYPRLDFVESGYRYYNSAIGRWINRDPIGERGGLSLYGFVGNEPVGKWDLLGAEAGIGMPIRIPDLPEPQNPLPEGPNPVMTARIKQDRMIRDSIDLLVLKMLNSRSMDCPSGETGVVTVNFDGVSADSWANMYNTTYFFLGKVGVHFIAGGTYDFDCCTKEHLGYNISVDAFWHDDFDELFQWGRDAPGLPPRHVWGSLPISWSGYWTETHSSE